MNTKGFFFSGLLLGLCLCQSVYGQTVKEQNAEDVLNSLHERTYEGDSSMASLAAQLVSFFADKHDTCSLIKALVLKSSGNKKKAEFENQLDDLVKAQRLYEISQCHPQTAAFIEHGYAFFHQSIRDDAKSDSIARRAISLFDEKWPDKTTLIKLYVTTSTVQSNYEMSLAYLDSALEISKEFKKPIFTQTILINIGSIYARRGNFETAKKYLTNAIPLARKRKEKRELAILFNNLAGLSENQDEILVNIDSAIYYTKLEGDLFHEQMFTENKAYFLSEAGNHKKGYTYLYKALQLKDSVLNEKKIDAVAEIQEKYEAEKRTNEIQQLKVEKLNTEVEKLRYRRNQNILIFGSSSLLVLFIILYVYFISVRKNRNRLAERNVVIQKERKRSDDLLLNILPSEVAEELKETGKAQAREFAPTTVLFTDFKGFTAMSSKMSASELVEEINACFKAFDNIVGIYRLEKIKTIGDAYMAAGGLQNPRISEPADVIKAGLEMQRFIKNRKAERDAKELMAFEMRVGIHSGPVVAGVVGVKKFQYDIWGDTVNTASRMESSGEVGEVNISETTYELTKHNQEFNFNFRGEIAAKGKGALPMWFVTSKSPTA